MPQQTPDNLQQCAAHHCNAIKVSDGCLFGSAPNPSTLQELADAGLKTVVDFRPASEWSCPDWPQRVQAAGMNFRHFPVSNVNEMTPTLTAAVWELWQDSTAQPLLMHCASGNRAAAALALAAVRHGGMNPQQALVLGQQAGLTKMLPAVQQCPEFCQ